MRTGEAVWIVIVLCSIAYISWRILLWKSAAVSVWMALGTTRIHSIEITERRIRGSSEIAYLTANYKTTFSLKEDSTLRQSLGSHLWILRKQAGRWLVTLVSWRRCRPQITF